jgi:hypothetical protein
MAWIEKGTGEELIRQKENRMAKTRLLSVMSLMFVVLYFGLTFPSMSADAAQGDAGKEVVKGTIDYNDRLGGYFVRGQEPGGEFFIVNQDKAALERLKESGEAVLVQGHTTDKGAEYFFIETINGKEYPPGGTGQEKPARKVEP